MKESSIEKSVGDYAEKLGWIHFKFVSPGNAGVPDRIFFRNGETILIEFKAPGEGPDPLQVMQIKRIKKQNIPVYVIDNVNAGKEVFNRGKE